MLTLDVKEQLFTPNRQPLPADLAAVDSEDCSEEETDSSAARPPVLEGNLTLGSSLDRAASISESVVPPHPRGSGSRDSEMPLALGPERSGCARLRFKLQRRLETCSLSIQALNTIMGFLLVICTIAVPTALMQASHQSHLDDVREQRELVSSTCFDIVLRGVPEFVAEMASAAGQELLLATELELALVPAKVGWLANYIELLGRASSWSWLSQDFRTAMAASLRVPNSGLAACGVFTSVGATLYMFDALSEGDDGASSFFVVSDNGTGGELGVMRADGAPADPVPYRAADLPEGRALLESLGPLCMGWCVLSVVRGSLGMWYALPVVDDAVGGTVLCRSRLPTLGARYRETTSRWAGSLAFAVEVATWHVVAVAFGRSSLSTVRGGVDGAERPLNASEADPPLLRQAWRAVTADSSVRTLYVGSERYLIHARHVERNVQWLVVFVAPMSGAVPSLGERSKLERDFAGQLEQIEHDVGAVHNFHLAIASLAGIIIVSITFVISQRIAAPFHALGESMIRVARLDFSNLEGAMPATCIREAMELYSAFDLMIVCLHEYRSYLPEGLVTPGQFDAVDNLAGSGHRGSPAPEDSSGEMPGHAAKKGPARPEQMENVTLPPSRGGKRIFARRESVRKQGSATGPVLDQRDDNERGYCGRSLNSSMRSSSSAAENAVRSPPFGMFKTPSQDLRRQRKASVLLCSHTLLGTPEHVSAHFVAVMECVRLHEGITFLIDGACLVGSWNAFVTHPPQHAARACSCAFEIAQSVRIPESMGVHTVVASSGAVHFGYVAARPTDQKKPMLWGRSVALLPDLADIALGAFLGAACPQRILDQVRWCVTGRAVDVFAQEGRDTPVTVAQIIGVDRSRALEGQASRARNNADNRHRLAAVQSWDDSSAVLWSEAFACFVRPCWAQAQELFESLLRMLPSDYQACRLLRLSTYFNSLADATSMVNMPFCRFRRGLEGWDCWEPQAALVILPAGLTDVDPPVPRRGESPRGGRASHHRASAVVPEHERLLREIEEFRELEESKRLPGPATLTSVSQASSGPPSSVDHGAEDQTQPSGRRGESIIDQRGQTWLRSHRLLGKGAFGEVWMGMGEDGQLVAMKSLRLPTAKDLAQQVSRRRRNRSASVAQKEVSRALYTQTQELVQEVTLLGRLRHENIVAYLGCALCKGYIWICTEYLPGGSLNDVCDSFGALSESHLARCIRDVLEGLSYLHSEGVVHRDIKPHNVLMQIDGQCKLTDFGAALLIASAAGGGGTGGPIGTPLYMAPEACLGSAGPAADVWGIGIMVLQLATGELPWTLDETFQPPVFIFALARDASKMPRVSQSLSPDIQQFALRCLSRDPTCRASVTELLSDPFLMSH
eukprot:TRINITY_DN2860_c0_g1_i1.p1 TRINITY_DN2860_c0_g1~~TRINITY_DN2860_c0_g1_i1.p1  ORF type:complete len:1362 (+),score=253.92 TRINITY_DN2860_c0_g1_i1:96-4181(+)